MASTINSSTSNGIVITPDTSGEIELQANGVTKAKVTANGLQDANGNSLRGGSFRNLIINGDMRIAQRGTSVSGITTSGYYTCDRWNHVFSTAGTWTFTQDTDVPSGQGFANSLKMACTTANASLSASSSFQLHYRFEGQHLQHLKKGTANAESVTLSFWIKSNKTGTYQVNIQDRDNTRMISSTYTIDSADTWEKKILTFAGDTTGAFDNDNNDSIRMSWFLVSGSNYNTGSVPTSWEATDTIDLAAGLTVNLADSTSNYINITGVQLEIGEGASDFEFLPYDVQLQRCQRYYQRYAESTNTNFTGWFGGVQYTGTAAYGDFIFTVPMRANPSFDFLTLSNMQILRNGAYTVPTNITASTTNSTARMAVITSGGNTAGHAFLIQAFSNHFNFDAEL